MSDKDPIYVRIGDFFVPLGAFGSIIGYAALAFLLVMLTLMPLFKALIVALFPIFAVAHVVQSVNYLKKGKLLNAIWRWAAAAFLLAFAYVVVQSM